jgi:archaellum biogenesis ATPase FlaH
MTDISIASPKVKALPAPRIQIGEYFKTVCLIHGLSGDGKSTLAQLLLNGNFEYLSTDAICLDPDGNIQSFLEQSRMGERYNFGAVAILIENNDADRFISFLFQKYIVSSDQDNILIDSFLFGLPVCRSILYKLCEQHHIRVWEIKRII